MAKNIVVLIMLLMALAMSRQTIPAVTITWTNTSGGNWSVANNWSPNQVPTNADNVLITKPGAYTVSLDVGSTYYTTNVGNLTLGAGGGAAGVQKFVVTNLVSPATFYVNSQLLVTNGGVLQMTNGSLVANSLIIAKGGMFNGQGESLIVLLAIVDGGVLNTANGSLAYDPPVSGSPSMIVTNGGILNANGDSLGSVTVANGGLCLANGVAVLDPYLGYGITVAHGGVLDITNSLGLYAPLTNAGIVNATNSAITIYNYYVAGHQYGSGGLVNQAGGIFNLQGDGSISGIHYFYQSVPYDYFINRGIMTKSGGTNSIDCEVFDNSQGTITNFSGTLVLGTFQTNLAGIYFAAAGATSQFVGANNATPLTPGTPFVLGGSGQYQFIAGFLALTNKAYPNLALIADKLVLGPAFQGGAITNLALDGIGLSNSLPVTGIFAATNSVISGTLTVASGGVFNENNAATYANVTVASGGVLNANGGDIAIFTNIFSGGWNVAHGGVVNLSGMVRVNAALTNAGTVNFSNAVVSINYHSSIGAVGGIVNQSGGVMDFFGGGSSIYFNYGPEYFINRGAVVQNSPGVTNTITVPGFDTSQGTVTNLAGTLLLGYFQPNLAGIYFAPAGATMQFIGGTAAAPVSPGTPLVLGGSGSYQFISDLVSLGTHGYLYLPTSVIPNLSMQGGLLELGPGFQGGAITNLTLNGIALTNQLGTTLPITGKFTVLNSGGFLFNYGAQPVPTGVYGNYTVAAGGTLTASNSFMRGAVTVATGGIMNMMRASMFGPLTLASGGLITVTGGGGTIYPSGSLTVNAGGTININQSGLVLEGPLNNAGTINITNPPTGGFGSVITSINDGSLAYQGGIINQASGLINLGSDKTFLNTDGDSFGGQEYIVNQGRITKSAGTNISGFSVPFLTNSGAITVQSGFISMRPFVTQSGGSLNVRLNSATSYGSFQINTSPYYTPFTNMLLSGAFNATLNNGYVPANGTSFNVVSVLSPDTYSGSFSSLGLPSAVNWQSSYGSTNFTLVAGSGSPEFGSIHLVGTNLIFNGTGGTAGNNYVVMVSTNVAFPLTSWTALTTNKFDGSGQFRYTNHVNPAKPRQFFIFKLP